MLIVIEGADGCGKTSVAEAVAKRFDTEVIAFPNDEAFTGPLIRSYLRKEWHVSPTQRDGRVTALVTSVDPSALAFQALNVVNKMELMPYIRAASAQRSLVLARYWQSAWVYGQLDGMVPDWLLQLHRLVAKPDINILLDVPADECMARRGLRDGALPPERYEGKLGFTQRVVKLYKELWASSAVPARWPVIDATKPLEEVVNDVLSAIRGIY